MRSAPRCGGLALRACLSSPRLPAPRRAAAVGALTACAWLLSAATAAGQFVWVNPAAGDWMTSTNWSPTGVPNTAAATATFSGSITGPTTVTLGSAVTVSSVSFTDVNRTSATAAYTIGGGATPGITFSNGSSDNLISAGGFTVTNQAFATNLTVSGSQPLSVTNNAAPGLNTLTLNGNVTGAGGTALNVGGQSDTTINGAVTGFGALTKTGGGTLTLTSVGNSYNNTVINGGTVSVASDSALGSTLPGTGGITLNGGALRITDATFATARTITLGAGGGLIDVRASSGTSVPGLGGVISGSGSLTFDGGAYVNLQAINTYTGATVIKNAGVSLVSDVFGSDGRLSNTSSITIRGGLGGQVGILTLDNSGGNDNVRIPTTAPITLNGGLFATVAPAAGANTSNFGALTVNGYGILFANQLPGGGVGTIVLNFGALTRGDPFTTLYVGGNVGGTLAPGTNTQIKFASGISSPGGSGQSIGIVPWVGGDRGAFTGTPPAPSGAPSGVAETLYTYDANGLRALDSRANTNFVQITTGALQAGKNNALTGDPAAMAGNLSIQSLVINPNSTQNSNINGTGILTVTSGAIANIQPLTFNGPTLAFGANTGFLWVGNDFTISGASTITGTNGLVVSSNTLDANGNSLILTNTANPNTFSGGLYLNGTARAAFDTSDTQLGAAGQPITLRGGSLRFIGAGSVTLATGGVNRPLVMDTAGGSINVETAGATLTVPGVVSGSDALTKLGPGTLVLANTANTYQGGTTISGGTLAVAGVGSLGSGAVQLDGGTLQFNGPGNLTVGVTNTGASTVNTNSNAVTFSGVVSGTGASLTKAGAGALRLTGNNTFTGNTVVSGGALLVNNTAGSGTGYGSVTVQSGGTLGGTGTIGGAVSVASGGTLAPGDGPGRLTVQGATTLASGSTFKVSLNGATAGTGYNQLTVTAGGSINLGGATLGGSLGYAATASDKLFIIDNQNPTGGLSGTFNGLPDGATVTLAGGTAVIHYFGDFGTGSLTGGNDVVLTNFVPVPEPSHVMLLGAGGILALRELLKRYGRRRAAAA
jgi:autotransporter-associated beta strand protein